MVTPWNRVLKYELGTFSKNFKVMTLVEHIQNHMIVGIGLAKLAYIGIFFINEFPIQITCDKKSEWYAQRYAHT